MRRPNDHGYHRLRLGRCSEVGRAYLVTTVVRHREPVFRHWEPARTCARTLRNAPRAIPVFTICWVVMPDHVHWLFWLEAGNLADVMRRFKSYSARQVNTLLGRAGPLWQSGFHDRAVRNEDDVRELARYLVANPLRAGLCAQVGDYPFWDAIWLDDREAENPLVP